MILLHQLRDAPDRPGLCEGPDRVLSWPEVWRRAQGVASELVELGVAPGDRVALVGPNVASWVVAQWGIAAAGAVAVPLYATATPGQWQQLVADSGARCLIRHASLSEVALPVPVLAMGHGEERAVRPEVGRRTEQRAPDDLAMLVYTSGTTARPKGVMLTWRNLAAVQQGVLGRYPHFAEPGAWRVVSHLPLNHVAEQLFTCILGIGLGGEVHLCPKMDGLFEMLRAVRPTFFMGVPRQWEKLDSLDGPLEVLGLDQLHTAASGSAPLPTALLARFAARGLPIHEGYGLTEAAGLLTLPLPGKPVAGTVGRPIHGVELRLGPDGEVLARGECLTRGYWQDPQASEALWEGGWLHTGDLGTLDEEGNLTLVGRIKDLIVTSGGSNVAPVPLEDRLCAVPGVSSAVVVGDERPYLVALIVGTGEALEPALLEALAQLDATLAPYQRIKRVGRIEALTQARGELTPTLKTRRASIQKTRAAAIEALYSAPAEVRYLDLRGLDEPREALLERG